MKMHAPQFQDFEAVNPAADQTDLRSADFDVGFEEGVAEGRRLAVEEDALMTAAAAQSLVDMQFGYAEARAHFVALLERSKFQRNGDEPSAGNRAGVTARDGRRSPSICRASRCVGTGRSRSAPRQRCRAIAFDRA